jgi:hypothetical protein
MTDAAVVLSFVDTKEKAALRQPFFKSNVW